MKTVHHVPNLFGAAALGRVPRSLDLKILSDLPQKPLESQASPFLSPKGHDLFV